MGKRSSSLATLVNKLPDPDEKGMLTNIDKEVVDNVISEIHKGGRRSIRGLVDMLVEPGEADDAKPRYALHCLAVYVCKLNDDRQRRAFTKALASQLGPDVHRGPKAVQGYLVRQLQVAGGREVAGVLGELLQDEELCEYAAQALTAIGDGAAEQLRSALPKAKGKCRLTIVQNLGVVRDSRAVRSLKEAINDEDREIRLAAAWALGNIGDAGSVDVLLRAADAESAYERIKATQACLVLAERLLAAAKKSEAVRIYNHLRNTRTESAEQYVRDAAEKGLAVAGNM